MREFKVEVLSEECIRIHVRNAGSEGSEGVIALSLNDREAMDLANRLGAAGFGAAPLPVKPTGEGRHLEDMIRVNHKLLNCLEALCTRVG